MNTFEYQKVGNFYTVWWLFAAILISFLITTFLDIASDPSTVYAIFIGIVIAQFFICEFRVKYWPITLEDDGVSFHSKSETFKLHWSDIESVDKFPTKEYQPTEWHQAMYSSGIMIKTVSGSYFAIYSKIKGFKALAGVIVKNT